MSGLTVAAVDLGAESGRVADPVTYRDAHRVEAFERALAEFVSDRRYSATGIELIEITALFGMLADAHERPEMLEAADLMLMMPEIFHNGLGGSRVTEFSVASTTGLYDIASGGWALGLFDDLGLPSHVLPTVVPAGTDVGGIVGDLAQGGLSKTHAATGSTPTCGRRRRSGCRRCGCCAVRRPPRPRRPSSRSRTSRCGRSTGSAHAPRRAHSAERTQTAPKLASTSNLGPFGFAQRPSRGAVAS
ncbi:hypothetical protein B7R22_00880 [Subtercola boreus]|uniref:Carbohydrate kinase FGGY N-terminal domain-containing protein n=1 Tax=Subtercola boreus TaxID=120213 RepID=A0A3E0W7F5_9MICO|nr:FGGY family carbohydrate kinase [Subtercola boreus]RFA17127.1 hypothetical protein B7R22_00880 [Subtercola boreus]